MTIHSYIEQLKQKPDHIKSRIAHGSAFGITLVIFAFWLGSFTGTTKNAQDTITHAVSQAGTPAQSLTASVGGFFSSIKDLVFTPRKVTYTDVQVTGK